MFTQIRVAAMLLLAAQHAFPQGIITTVAGADFSFPSSPVAALNAPLGYPRGLALDSNGNLYIADLNNNLILKMDITGTVSVAAGNGTLGYSGDGGPATNAALRGPECVIVDPGGNLYICDSSNDLIRKVTPDGIITTIAGNFTYGFTGDGVPATSTALYGPQGLAMDAAGNLYIADTFNNRIRKVTPDGIITTVAGTGESSDLFAPVGDDGLATEATLNLPGAVAVDIPGNLYISDWGDQRIRKVTPDGIITTVAGNGMEGYSGDGGDASLASLDSPAGITVDAAGNLFIADQFNNVVRKVTPGGIISTVAGNGFHAFSGDGGPATLASFYWPLAVVTDVAGNLFIADSLNARVRKVDSQGTVSTIAGNGNYRFSGDGGNALGAILSYPEGVALDASGNIFIADSDNNRIRKLAKGGTISTVAGNGELCCYSDGSSQATTTPLDEPSAVAQFAGSLYIAEPNDGRIRKLTPDGMIATVAGGYNTALGDGERATGAELSDPEDVAFDLAGNMYIADSFNNRIRQVATNQIISTVAGNGTFGFSGDGGLAASASLNLPEGVAVDTAGDLFIADWLNCRVREVTGGVIQTIAGNGTCAYSGDGGPATSAQISPQRIAVDSAGDLFIADSDNNRIRKVTPDGTISTVAGNGAQTFSGDGGLATAALLNNPMGIAVDAAGNLFFADSGNNRIREILAGPAPVTASPTLLQFTANSRGAPPPVQTISFTSSVQSLEFAAVTTVPWLQLSLSNGMTGYAPGLIEVTADPTNLRPGTYNANIALGTPYGTPFPVWVNVVFTVGPAQPPALSVDKPNLTFAYPSAAQAISQSVTISNSGSGALPLTVAIQTRNGGDWLSVSPASGTALPAAPAIVSVIANPAGLPPGTYTASLTIASGAMTKILPITMMISNLSQAILLSQTGLSFLAVAQGGIVPPQTFGVINIGSGSIDWTVSTSTLSGGAGWLQVSATQGSTDASAPTVPTVTVTANTQGLAPGTYYGLVQVAAPNAANSPQVLTVFLQVLPAGSSLGAVAQPAQMLFSTPAGVGSPGSQDLLLYNITGTPKSFWSSIWRYDSRLILRVLPGSGTLDPQHATHVVIQPLVNNLPPGVYDATVTLQFSDGTLTTLKISATVTAGPAAAISLSSRSRALGPAGSASCTPTKLLPALTTLSQSFAVSAGWPVALGVNVTDDCGSPLDSGSVSVSFSTGEAPLALQPLKGGRWEGTWNTQNQDVSQAVLTISSQSADGTLSGQQQISGALQSQTNPPVFQASGVVSAADNNPFEALAPGSIISIYGNQLASGLAFAGAAPLPDTLLDTEVLIAGRVLPLYFVNQNQVNAFVSSDLNVNTTYQIYLRRGNTYSQAVSVNVAPAQPAIFIDQTVSASQGVITVVPNDGSQPFEAQPGSPAHAGDAVVIYCSGLGAVNGMVADGVAAGAALSTTNTVQATIGGQPAPVMYSGLTPGSVGLYQVNVQVPDGIAPADTVPVTLSVAGETSTPATMAVQ